MINEEIYRELHTLKQNEDVKRFVELLGLARLDSGLGATHIKDMGFTKEFVDEAQSFGYSLFGELMAEPVENLANELTSSHFKELAYKAKILGFNFSIPVDAIAATA